MKTKILSISLAIAASVLVACGGGSDARSPDRANPKLDPTSLRIDFPLGTKLAGLGTSKVEDGILARMVALQADGVNKNLGPQLNVTGETTWSISGPVGDPAIADLAAAVRQATSFGKVKDIISTAFLAEPQGPITLTLNGSYTFEGTAYVVSEEFTVVPPKRVPPPFITGPEIIAIDPLDADATATASYQLVQALRGLTQRENRTAEAQFCANKGFFKFAEYAGGQTAATATITNPFDSSNSQEAITVIISTIAPSSDCTLLYDDDTANDPATFAVKTIIIQPAAVKSVDVCVVVNPAGQTCNGNGDLDQTVTPLTSCKGLDNGTAITEATVPAGETLQMVAKLHYENPANADQVFDRYQCRGAGVLSWSGTPTDIYSTNLSTTDGTATLIGQADYNAIRNNTSKNNSLVTASYKNSLTSSITGNLKLNLTDADVDSVTIRPINKDGSFAAVNSDKIYNINYSILQEDQDFVAICNYSGLEARCGDSTVKWTVSAPAILKVNPEQDPMTTASPTTPANPTFGSSALIATYKGSLTDSVTVNVIDDRLVALYLLQQQDDPSQAPIVDEFSCLGSGNYSINASRENGFDFSTIPGSRKFYAHALLKSAVDAGADPATVDPADLSILKDVSELEAVIYTADVGYYDSANKTCVVAPITESIALPEDSIPTDTPLDAALVPLADALGSGVPAEILDALPLPLTSAGKPAEFSATEKGLLVTQGDARLATMCIRVFVDADKNLIYTAAKPAEGSNPAVEADPLSENGASVLIQPAGTIALQDQAGSICQILDPLLSANDDLSNQLLLPALFNLGYYGDPAISQLPVGDALNQIPVDALLDAILTSDFSDIPGIDQLPVPIPSDLDGVQAILGDLITALSDAGGEGLPTDDVIAAITSLVGMIPGAEEINPEDLTSALEGLNPEELAATLAGALATVAEQTGLPIDQVPDLSALNGLLDTLGLGDILSGLGLDLPL
ncbi:hypothetical protein DOK_02886 [gamma proteobacterium BDW918]|uniref:Uncharacterized protein n=1 Tax=Zhongshania aliphaticivorans TaxID=1470434 RepID=A0A127M3Z6_9GAMM|nr:hypothetical protein [Zhongshania aliphaticivorans]AMO67933.1 hypothetical protein AZF00_06275 [Zhongshania aliphaticivorans]EIF44622.1 hypothetical protein DOK_02886 [gamma proteobacterium BDW918]